ncbi:hypothetical protein ACNKHV_16320 [Shigella flexneri]
MPAGHFVRDNQINRVAALQHTFSDGLRLAHQRGLYFSTGGVGGMKNTTVTMSTFTGQMVLSSPFSLTWVSNKPPAQLIIAHRIVHCWRQIQLHGNCKIPARRSMCFDMPVNAVSFIKHGGNTALG